ncbi:MAG: cutinase family protein [Nocardioidaceae bacterium]|nr:cutinase family protein [Nocardioidaceae bacterium]
MSNHQARRWLASVICLLLLPFAGLSIATSTATGATHQSISKKKSAATKAKAKKAKAKKTKSNQAKAKWCRKKAGKWAKAHRAQYTRKCGRPTPKPATPLPTPPKKPTPPAPGPDTHCGSLTADATWSAGPTHRLTCSVDIPVGKTLTIAAGTVVKAGPGSGITVEGRLLTNGTPASPVTFTSIKDNTIGGTTGTGNPNAGDWSGITTNHAGAVAHLDGVVIRHAAIALNNIKGYDVRIRGVLREDAIGVQGSDDWTDARWVDWGDTTYGPSPSPSNLGIKRTGASVTVMPWIGMQTPPVPTVSAHPPPNNQTCTDVTIYGLRYSGAQPQVNPPSLADANYGTDDTFGADGPAEVTKAVFDGMSANSKVVAIQYPALGVPEMTPFGSYSDFLTSFYIGGLRLVSAMRGEAARCPNTKFVATGYSQGAAAIRFGLGRLNANDPLIDKIAGLILLGDPGKPANVTERLYSSKKADPPNPPPEYIYDLNKASATVKARAGYFAEAFPQYYGHLPGTLPSKTWNICHERDFVCAAGPGTKFSDHASIWYPVYTVPEIQTAAWQIRVTMVDGSLPY